MYIAHYNMDILCKRVFGRNFINIPTMGDKAVFYTRNMPLDLEDCFIYTTLVFQFIPGWFPHKETTQYMRQYILQTAGSLERIPIKCQSHHPLHRNQSPQ